MYKLTESWYTNLKNEVLAETVNCYSEKLGPRLGWHVRSHVPEYMQNYPISMTKI